MVAFEDEDLEPFTKVSVWAREQPCALRFRSLAFALGFLAGAASKLRGRHLKEHGPVR